MRALVSTVDGPRNAIIKGPSGIASAVSDVADRNVQLWPYPSVYGSGVRYQLIGNKRGELFPDWKWCLGTGVADCAPLVAARVGELVASGTDEGAVPLVYPAGVGNFHVVTLRSDGSVEDPSKVLGMTNATRPMYRLMRMSAGFWRALVAVPVRGGNFLVAEGWGTSGADAICLALEDIEYSLDQMGAFDELQEVGYVGSDIPPEIMTALGEGAASMMPAAADTAASLIGDVWSEIETFMTGTDYDAFGDYIAAVASSDAGVDASGPREHVIARILSAGWIPIYCSDSQGTRDDIIREFGRLGWPNASKWWQEYDIGWGRRSDWYGATFRASQAPSGLVAAANESTAGWVDAFRMLTDAKAFTGTYGTATPFRNQAILALRAWILVRAAAGRAELSHTSPFDEPGPELSHTDPFDSYRATDGRGPLREGGRGDVLDEPPQLSPDTADRLVTMRAMSLAGRQGDWQTLATIARELRREGGGRAVRRAMRQSIRTFSQALLRSR